MHEDDILGVQIPGTGEFGFVSVMGNLGEHFAVAICEGQKGLSGFWDMQEMGKQLTPEFVLQIPQMINMQPSLVKAKAYVNLATKQHPELLAEQVQPVQIQR